MIPRVKIQPIYLILTTSKYKEVNHSIIITIIIVLRKFLNF